VREGNICLREMNVVFLERVCQFFDLCCSEMGVWFIPSIQQKPVDSLMK
jgi:hypothetical protein